MYNIKVEKDSGGNVIKISCEKDGITVEFDINSFEPIYGYGIMLDDVIEEFDNTIKQGELLNA